MWVQRYEKIPEIYSFWLNFCKKTAKHLAVLRNIPIFVAR